MNIGYYIGIFWLSKYNLSALTIYKYPMCQILINLVDILEKIFINIVNSVCEHHESVIFVAYDTKNIYTNILHDIFLSYAEKTPKISILTAILNKLAF